MRAARSFGSGEVRIEELPAPAPVPGPGEVVCEVLACGVCATDVLDWYVAERLPAVLGHEPTGIVAAIAVPARAEGDRQLLGDPERDGALLELLAGGRIDADRLISHRLGLEQTGRALDLQRRGEGLKLVIAPALDAPPGTR